ncbi:hypothetical protein KFK14_12590 [Sphingobium phenoxybenzoativorans]|uniref:Uncharacterized protein n=1 Tax=Sphingobium phenoxybenzoativorans TaxID=1592790 RepID=A0A975Q038_9SPHN|nr:hypothetical protein [Sphingobium phenoxybenzoativorans]QUT03988.1 hypothetical protein KFK14_12590 [Sphingobium phenoxybenzoativorans]
MASDRLTDAIARMDAVLGRLEAFAAAPRAPDVSPAQAPTPKAMNDDSRARAVEALKSLDSLIAEMKARG